MFIDRHVEAYIEETLMPQQSVRRLANGSVDYTFYDRRARPYRSATFIEETLVPQQSVRRLANGSVDYAFYDRRARRYRSAAFHDAGRAIVRLVRRAAGLLAQQRRTAQTAADTARLVVAPAE